MNVSGEKQLFTEYQFDAFKEKNLAEYFRSGGNACVEDVSGVSFQ